MKCAAGVLRDKKVYVYFGVKLREYSDGENIMYTQIRQYCILTIFGFFSFGFLNMALAESTTVTNSGIKFPDGTTQTTAATGGSSPWSQSDSNIYYNGGDVGIGTRNPMTMLTINDGTQGGYRTWMQKGLLVGWDSDNVFFGLKDEGVDRKDAVIAWGDGYSSDHRDNLRFIYAESSDPDGSFEEFMRINSFGNVGIGTTSPDYPLEMASGAHVTTGGVWTDASSRDYKENIRDLTYNEAKLALTSLKPSRFNYKVDKDDEYLGFIAEDVPDLVATKDRKGLSPMDIVAVLTKVVQRQQEIVEQQQEEIEKLRNLISTKQ